MKKQKVNRYTLDGILIDSFDSLTKAANVVGSQPAAIIVAIKRDSMAAGYRFRYANDGPPKLGQRLSRYRSGEVQQLNKNGQVVARFASVTEAAKQFNISLKNAKNGIYKAIGVETRTAYGYVWKYTQQPRGVNQQKKADHSGGKAIQQFTLTGHLVAQFPSIADAARAFHPNRLPSGSAIYGAVSGARQSAYGYVWKYIVK